MAREASITQEQVNAAADTIRATGTKPTARAVRDALGTGSMATVLKFLQVWQAGQVQPAAQDVTLPPALTRSLVDFIGQEVAKAKAGLEADLASAQQASADLIAESERQSLAIEAQEKALEEAYGDKAELVGKLGQVEADLDTARDEAGRERQAAEAARTELAKAQLRLEALPRIEAEAERLRGELQAERLARAEAERQAAVSTAKLEAAERAKAAESEELRRQVKQAEARADKAEAKSDKAEQTAQAKAEELATANTTIHACQARLESAERELTSARKSAEEARASAKKAGEEAAELKGELTVTRAALEKAGKDLAAAAKEKK